MMVGNAFVQSCYVLVGCIDGATIDNKSSARGNAAAVIRLPNNDTDNPTLLKQL